MLIFTHPLVAVARAWLWLTDPAGRDARWRERWAAEHGRPWPGMVPPRPMPQEKRTPTLFPGERVSTADNSRCKFAGGGARCVSHCGDPICCGSPPPAAGG